MAKAGAARITALTATRLPAKNTLPAASTVAGSLTTSHVLDPSRAHTVSAATCSETNTAFEVAPCRRARGVHAEHRLVTTDRLFDGGKGQRGGPPAGQADRYRLPGAPPPADPGPADPHLAVPDGTCLLVTPAGLPEGWDKGVLGGRSAEPWTLNGLAPGGGMWSTSADLATWMRLTRDGRLLQLFPPRCLGDWRLGRVEDEQTWLVRCVADGWHVEHGPADLFIHGQGSAAAHSSTSATLETERRARALAAH